MSPLAPILTASHAALSNPEACAIMRLSLLDWLACGIAGQTQPVARVTRQLVLDEAGAPQASLFGGGRVPARAAALANGAASHALDYDDTHFAHIGHPSVAVIPAALALAQRQDASLEQMLQAALLGCEASVRFGVLFGRGHYQVGFHQTATAGALGAALAGARLLDLDPDQTVHALNLVTTRASGLKSQFGTMGKPFNAGIAASNGVEAALLAAQGFVSAPQALDGGNGFLATHHCDGTADQPQQPWMTTVSHKFHACCHGLHATLDALALLPHPDPGQITAIHIATHPRWLTVCNIPQPQTGLELKFSYRAIVAAALLGHDTAALGTYTDALCADPLLMQLRDKVSVTPDPGLSETESLVRIETGAGDLEGHHDLNTPLPLARRSQRLMAKAASLLGAESAARIWQAIETDNVSQVTAFM